MQTEVLSTARGMLAVRKRIISTKAKLAAFLEREPSITGARQAVCVDCGEYLGDEVLE